ncbi:MAG: hypothetical protein AABZ12_13765 [Planctomycetota bacterium]
MLRKRSIPDGAKRLAKPAAKLASPLAKGGSRVVAAPAARPSALLDTRIIYCGDCLDQLRKLSDACVDLIYIDPPFNSNRNCEVFWGEVSKPRAQASGVFLHLEGRHASTQAYIDYMRPPWALWAKTAPENVSPGLDRLQSPYGYFGRNSPL